MRGMGLEPSIATWGLYTKRQKSHANDLRTLYFKVLTPRLMDREAQAKRELISLLESAEFGR
jgi:hypothetical protein